MALAETQDFKGAVAALKDYLAQAAGAADGERVRGLIAEFEKR